MMFKDRRHAGHLLAVAAADSAAMLGPRPHGAQRHAALAGNRGQGLALAGTGGSSGS